MRIGNWSVLSLRCRALLMHKGNRRDVVQFVYGDVWGIYTSSLFSARIKGFRLIHKLSERQ